MTIQNLSYKEAIAQLPKVKQLEVKHLNHYDINHSSLQDISNSLHFIASACADNNDGMGNEICSILNIINKEVAYLQDENKRHSQDLRDFGGAK